MKQRKRIAALVTAGIMALSLFPGNALAAETEPAEGEQTCICETFCTEGSIDENCLVCAADLTQCLGMDTPEGEDTGTDAPDAEGGEAGEQPEQPDDVADIDPDVAAVQALIDALPTAAELESMTQEERNAAYMEVQDAYDAYLDLSDEQKDQITGAEVFDDLFAVFNGMTNALATTNNVSYLDEDGNQQEVDNVTVVDSSTTAWNAGWYVVNTNVTISDRITVSGEVHLILADGNTLTARQGITVTGSNSLTIYGQRNGTGALNAGGDSTPANAAGIGGVWNVSSPSTPGTGGTITINGGTVTAQGGSNAAGIGGGNIGAGGSVTINGGTVNATGGSNGAGIGGGGGGGAGGTITINGGTVNATGTSTSGGGAAGIGGGQNGGGGTVTINGGTVTAIGSGAGSGIGRSNPYGGSTGNCSITGDAVVFATGGANANGEHISATGGSSSWDGIVFQGNDGRVYGDVTLANDLTIESGQSLTVPSGTTLTIPEGTTLTNNGTITNSGTIEEYGQISGNGVSNSGGTVSVPATVSVTVTPSPATYGSTVSITANISQASSNALTRAGANQVEFFVGTGNSRRSLGTAPVSNNTAILSNVSVTTETGWTLGDNTITAEYGGGTGLLGNSGTATLTVTLPNADIQLTVKNGEQTTSTFTYGDTITIEGTVSQAASNVSTNDLTQNQVGLFLGSIQLGSAATVDSNGSFTLSYSTTGKGIPIGDNQTLTVRYSGSSTLNSGYETVSIKLNRKQVEPAISGTTTKVYDGTTAAPEGLTITLTGVLNNDNVIAQASSITYDNAAIGTNRMIVADWITLGGTDRDYYALSKSRCFVTGSITAATASVDSAPAAVPNLTYTGQAQALVTAGAASNGTMVYALGTDATTAPDSFSTTIPQGTNAGAYYVWYKVQANENYSDTTPVCVTVTIAKKELTVSATANDKTYDGSTTASGSVTLTGAVNGEQPTATGAFAFEDADAGNGKTVNVTDIALTGTWDTNYTLDTTSTSTTADIAKATPTLSLTASSASLTGGGNVVLTLSGLPSGETATVTCSDSAITVTANGDGSWTAENLPNQTKDYTFTAAFAGNDNYEAAAANCTVAVTYQSTGGGFVPTRPWRPSRPVEPEEPEDPAEPETPALNGWVQEDGVWYLYQGGSLATGWNRYNGTWYYLDSNGKMLTGWQRLNGTWYYLHDWGGMATGWLNLNGTGYYLRDWGGMATGWLNLNGTWYYLRDWGGMATGWLNLNGTWYYLRDWGGMATGWLNLNGTWYYLRDWGGMATGWLNLNGTWYYLRDWGGMAANTTTPDGYRVGPSGAWIQ